MVNCRNALHDLCFAKRDKRESWGCFVLMHLVHCMFCVSQTIEDNCVCCNCSVELYSACMAVCQS